MALKKENPIKQAAAALLTLPPAEPRCILFYSVFFAHLI